jgi:hypothetical protein
LGFCALELRALQPWGFEKVVLALSSNWTFNSKLLAEIVTAYAFIVKIVCGFKTNIVKFKLLALGILA